MNTGQDRLGIMPSQGSAGKQGKYRHAGEMTNMEQGR
jgi:hypothetical protein